MLFLSGVIGNYEPEAAIDLVDAIRRELAPGDWMAQDTLVACPDPDEGLIMKIERMTRRTLNTDDLT